MQDFSKNENLFYDLQNPEAAAPANACLASNNEELLLWCNFKKGSRLAFTTLYKRYIQQLYNYGRHLSADHELVKDCLQELFAYLWNNKEKLSDVGSVRHYLFKSFRRRLIAELVSRKKLISEEWESENTEVDLIMPIESSLIEEQMNQEQHRHLTVAINKLAKRQKEAVFLKFYGDMSYPEVASVMQMQVESVYNIISKAIDTLRKNLKRITLLLLLLTQHL